MTFDDGILKIYTTINTAENGAKPLLKLQLKESYYFGFDVMGINRYFTALQAKSQLEHVVNIPGWGDIRTTDIAELEDGSQYRIVMIQPQMDEAGLRITKLSLERISNSYDYYIETPANPGNTGGNNES